MSALRFKFSFRTARAFSSAFNFGALIISIFPSASIRGCYAAQGQAQAGWLTIPCLSRRLLTVALWHRFHKGGHVFPLWSTPGSGDRHNSYYCGCNYTGSPPGTVGKGRGILAFSS